MNLSQIIEKKKEEFFEEDWSGLLDVTSYGIVLMQQQKFLEKAIRESVEEALREVIPKRKGWTDVNKRDAYNDCVSQVKLSVKEFMK